MTLNSLLENARRGVRFRSGRSANAGVATTISALCKGNSSGRQHGDLSNVLPGLPEQADAATAIHRSGRTAPV